MLLGMGVRWVAISCCYVGGEWGGEPVHSWVVHRVQFPSWLLSVLSLFNYFGHANCVRVVERAVFETSVSQPEKGTPSLQLAALFCLILFGSLRAARPGHEMSFKG
jgi:hypothetical protein